jgi:hypothetical protein
MARRVILHSVKERTICCYSRLDSGRVTGYSEVSQTLRRRRTVKGTSRRLLGNCRRQLGNYRDNTPEKLCARWLMSHCLLTSCDAYNIAMEKADANTAPDAADKDFFQRLRGELEDQIVGYVYEAPEGALGTPLPAEEIRALLDSMRPCLVEPCWEEVNICNTPLELVGLRHMCVTMAEDEGYVLVFDPVDEEYHLAWRSEHGLRTWGIRSGDGVECFIAR